MNEAFISREELEQIVETRTRELTTLLQISRDVTSNLSLESVLQEILEKLETVVHYTNAAIARLDGAMFYAIAYQGQSVPKEEALKIKFPASNFIDQKVMASLQPLIISNVLEDETEDAQDFRRQAAPALKTFYKDTRTWMRVPLMFKGKVTGMLTLHYHQPNFYTQRHANLAMAFAEHAAIAIENARLYEQAHQLAALEERQKLARELHDSVSQALYGIVLGARTARTLLERDPSRVADPLEYISTLAEAGLAEMRALIFELRPESLQMEGLVAALIKQTDALRARHQLVVDATFCPEPEVSLEIKEVLYRIAQEALHNIVKHARASHVEVTLGTESNILSLSIRDNGLGFDPAGEFPGHLGLRSMRERVEKVQGNFHVESASGKGTVIEVKIFS